MTACGSNRTVLARNVPDKTTFLVPHDVDSIEPDTQPIKFTVWR